MRPDPKQFSTHGRGYFWVRATDSAYIVGEGKTMATKLKGDLHLSVLQIGYYASLLETRSSMLERDGYKVTSALGNKQGMAAATKDHFDVVVIGFSGALSDRIQVVRWLK